MILIVLLIVLCAAAPAAAQEDPLKAAYDSSPCQMCHGASGEGDAAPALVPMTYELPEFSGIVRQGVGHMPAIPRSEISDADLQLVFSFLKRETVRLPPSPENGSGATGKADTHSIQQIRARIDRARRASDLAGLAAAADDARKLSAEADLASAYAEFEAIAQAPAAGNDARLAEAKILLTTIISGVKGSGPVAPDDGRLVFLEGVSSALSPESSGGLDTAERLLRRATELLGTPASTEWPAWGAADAWAWLGRVLAQRGDAVGARRAYQKALELAPGYIWVTRVLLPALK